MKRIHYTKPSIGEQELELPLQPRWIQPNPRIDAIRDSVAIMRGPLVYCLEETDQPEGINLLDVRADTREPLEETWREDLLGGVVTVQARGWIEDGTGWEERQRSVCWLAPACG